MDEDDILYTVQLTRAECDVIEEALHYHIEWQREHAPDDPLLEAAATALHKIGTE